MNAGMQRTSWFWVFLLSLLSTGPQLLAHTFAPSLLELHQAAGGNVAVRFKQPEVRVAGSRLRPVLPPSCQPAGVPEVAREGTGIVTLWQATCGDLVGAELAVEGIADSRADVLLRLQLADGRVLHQILTADQPSFRIPETAGFWGVAAVYVGLGVQHILLGFDHLLFVLGLVLLVQGRQRLLFTITAFTLGHSVTLALAALGMVHVPSGPTEAAIALSIFVLAGELARSPKSAEDSSWLQRSPWLVGVVFGLLHGLGFAGALSEVGLPAGEIPAALFSFNVGIEIGQLAFIAVVLAAGWALARLPRSLTARLASAPAYVIGTLAAFWFCGTSCRCFLNLHSPSRTGKIMPENRFFSPRRRENALWASAVETYLRHSQPQLSLRERRNLPMMQGVYEHLRANEKGQVLPVPATPAEFAALDPVMQQAQLSQTFHGLATLHLTAVTGGADFCRVCWSRRRTDVRSRSREILSTRARKAPPMCGRKVRS